MAKEYLEETAATGELMKLVHSYWSVRGTNTFMELIKDTEMSSDTFICYVDLNPLGLLTSQLLNHKASMSIFDYVKEWNEGTVKQPSKFITQLGPNKGLIAGDLALMSIGVDLINHRNASTIFKSAFIKSRSVFAELFSGIQDELKRNVTFYVDLGTGYNAITESGILAANSLKIVSRKGNDLDLAEAISILNNGLDANYYPSLKDSLQENNLSLPTIYS